MGITSKPSSSQLRLRSETKVPRQASLVELCAAQNWSAVLKLLQATSPPTIAELTATTGASKWTPLHFVASADKTPREVLSVLLERVPVGPSASAGSTPLHLAAWNGRSFAVESLLAAGAPVGAKSAAGRTPLHFAARRGHAGIASQLIEAGADVHEADREGRTPLHAGGAAGAQDVTAALLTAGADPVTKCKDGRTAGDIAADSGHFQMADELQGHVGFGAPRPSDSEPPDAGPRWVGRVRSTLTRARSMVAKILPVNDQQDRGSYVSALSQVEITNVLQARATAGVEPVMAGKYCEVLKRAVERFGLTGELIVNDEPSPEKLVEELLKEGRSMEYDIPVNEGGLYHTLVTYIRKVREARAIGMIQSEAPVEASAGAVHRKEMYMAVGAGVLFSLLVSRK